VGKTRKENDMGSFGTNISSAFTSISNWFRGLSRTVQFAIIGGLIVFTPVVSMFFSIVFGILGFILGFVQWKTVMLIVLAFAGYKAYQFFQADLAEDTTDDTDPFL
jgi:hypothetical protein